MGLQLVSAALHFLLLQVTGRLVILLSQPAIVLVPCAKRILWIEPDRLLVIGDNAVVVAIVLVRIPPVDVVGATFVPSPRSRGLRARPSHPGPFGLCRRSAIMPTDWRPYAIAIAIAAGMVVALIVSIAGIWIGRWTALS